MEKTLCIIKPDAVKNSFVEDINKSIKSNGLEIINSKRIKLSFIIFIIIEALKP